MRRVLGTAALCMFWAGALLAQSSNAARAQSVTPARAQPVTHAGAQPLSPSADAAKYRAWVNQYLRRLS